MAEKVLNLFWSLAHSPDVTTDIEEEVSFCPRATPLTPAPPPPTHTQSWEELLGGITPPKPAKKNNSSW